AHVAAAAPVGAQRAQDERDAHVGVLASDVAEQLTQLGIELASTPAIGARLWHERFEATLLERVEPALEGRNRVAARRVAARGAHARLAEATQQGAALAVV